MSASLYSLDTVRGQMPIWGSPEAPSLDLILGTAHNAIREHTHSGSGADGTKIDGAYIKNSISSATIGASQLNDHPSHQTAIGGATAVALSSGNTELYTIWTADYASTLTEVGLSISGLGTITDVTPSTDYIVTQVWDETAATKMAKSTLLGVGGATQILPHSYVTLTTTAGLSTAQVAADDVVGLRFVFTNKGASAGIPRPVARIQYTVD